MLYIFDVFVFAGLSLYNIDSVRVNVVRVTFNINDNYADVSAHSWQEANQSAAPKGQLRTHEAWPEHQKVSSCLSHTLALGHGTIVQSS